MNKSYCTISIPAEQAVPFPKCGKDIAFTMLQSIDNEMSFVMKEIITINSCII